MFTELKKIVDIIVNPVERVSLTNILWESIWWYTQMRGQFRVLCAICDLGQTQTTINMLKHTWKRLFSIMWQNPAQCDLSRMSSCLSTNWEERDLSNWICQVSLSWLLSVSRPFKQVIRWWSRCKCRPTAILSRICTRSRSFTKMQLSASSHICQFEPA
jgi:hypothetical protein